MSHSKEGLNLLEKIIKLPKTIIYNYYIHALGYFDEEWYENYLESQDSNMYSVKDKTIFFRKLWISCFTTIGSSINTAGRTKILVRPAIFNINDLKLL